MPPVREASDRRREPRPSGDRAPVPDPEPATGPARVQRLQASAGNRATSAALAGREPVPRSGARRRLARLKLSAEELDMAKALTGGDDGPSTLAFTRVVGRQREAIASSAAGAAFDGVIKPHVTAAFVKELQEFAKGMVTSNKTVHARAGREAEKAFAANLERLRTSGPSGNTAKARYADLQATAAGRKGAWDKSLFVADIQTALKDAAADLGIEQAALKVPQLGELLGNARRQLEGQVEAIVLNLVSKSRESLGRNLARDQEGLKYLLGVYTTLDEGGEEQDRRGDSIRGLITNLQGGTSDTGLAPMLEEVVESAHTFARNRAEVVKPALATQLLTSWRKGDIDREKLIDAAISETAGVLGDEKKVETLGADAVRVVSEGEIHAAFAKAAPLIDLLVSKPDSAATLKIALEVPIKGAVVGFEFICRLGLSSAKELSIAVDVGMSAGVGIAAYIKASLGGGVYVEAKSKAGAVALMDSVSLALYRRFSDIGVPYTDDMWGLGGRTRREGESETDATTREAQAWAAMVEEEMGESGEVETGGYVKGAIEANTGPLFTGGVGLIGKGGTLLDKRAFDKTKDRKAATSGFTITLSAAIGPLKGALIANIRNVTYAEPGKDAVETSGSIRATLGGEVPGAAIYGDPLMMGMRIASWLVEMRLKVGELIERIKDAIAKEEARSPEAGDIMKIYGVESPLQEAGEQIKGGITGEWAEKHAAFVKASAEGGGESAVKQLYASTAGVTLGLLHNVNTAGEGKGAVYLDLAKTMSLNVGVATFSFATGERVWSKKWGE